MPISAHYKWEETDDCIDITIPFKAKTAKKADIFLAETILKISHPPYLLDINLAEKIDYPLSKVLYQDNIITIKLQKVVKGLWGKLTFVGSKEETRVRRTDAISRMEQRVKNQHEKARTKRIEEERMSLKKQMALEQAEWQKLQDMKTAEKDFAEEEMYDSIARIGNLQKLPINAKKSANIVNNSVANALVKIQYSPSKQTVTAKDDNMLIRDLSSGCSTNYLPYVRPASIMNFSHTPRIFKTPIRESIRQQEEDFIVKNRPYLMNNSLLNSKETNPGEESPIWLKDRGDEFYRNSDYLSAINAYSAAFEGDATFVQAVANRSACYLQINEGECCIRDCVQTLQLLDERAKGVASDIKSRIFRKKIFVRMGCACCQLSDINSISTGLKHLRTAFELDQSDELLAEDIRRLATFKAAFKYKIEADNAFSKGNILLAIKLYGQAVLEESTFISAISNCSAAHFMEKKFEECIRCCSVVLKILEDENVPSPQNQITGNITFGSIPSPGSKDRQKIVLATLCRRGSARFQLKEFNGALLDLVAASKVIKLSQLTPQLDLEEDIKYVKSQMKTGLRA